MVGWGRSATLAGNVIGSLPDGLTAPNRILAMASAPFCPGNQASSTALTFPSHGITCAPPFSMTTMVWGFAAATAATSASWSIGLAEWITSVKFRLGVSIPSLVHCETNTIATSDEPARDAAADALVPLAKRTVAAGDSLR